ncbi:MAG: hypothetical protein IJW36_01925 [Clostridia bacterium]|nr:hypothetical protein [Clostridia bacterium]
MNTTYAYFTATATEKKSTTSTATIKISITDDDKTISDIDNTVIYTSSSTDSATRNLLPGDKLIVSGTLVNGGTAECYAIIEFNIDATLSDSSVVSVCKKYYTFVIDETSPLEYTQTEIEIVNDTYSTHADIICADNESDTNTDDERDFEFTFTFTGADFGNTYKNANITYSVKAYAIQSANLATTAEASAQKATELLMQKIFE